ncbi:hypothetical protein H4S02_001592 [Coemansia sp. RSA 2611]|nr:hypothetical protein H4S02_001592 [Coemansia sp. RSA 2611]
MPRSVCTAGGSSWEAVSIVKGVRIALDAGDYLEQLHTKNCGEDGTVVEVGEVDNRDIQAVGIVYRPAQTPAVFAAGSAYIVCGQSTPNYRKPGASLDIALYELGALDHVHPVRLNLADSEPFPAAQLDTGLTEVTQCIPEVRISVVSDNAQRQLWPPPVYSISDLFASHSAGGHVADSCDSSKPRCVLDKNVSVWGIIAQREVKKAVSFVPDKRGDNSRVDPASVIGQLESHITLQDANDSTMTAVVYIKLSSYSHPLGLVPGAKIVCRDVVFNVSKSSGNPYLTGTPVTSIDAVAAEAIPADPGDTAIEMAQEGDQPIGMCIGALYAVQQTCQVELGCCIKSVESLKLSMVCISCKQTVRRMGCGCARKQHYLVPADRGVKRAATAVAEAELLCLVSDGSGIAWMAASGDVALADVLALAREELTELYDGAAQSWNGLLTWKAQQHKDQAPPPSWHAAVDRAAATAVNASVLVEGTVVQRGPLPVKRQPLRLDGHDYAMDKLLAPRIAAVRVTRPTAAELSWHMLGRLGV